MRKLRILSQEEQLLLYKEKKINFFRVKFMHGFFLNPYYCATLLF